MLAVDPRDQRIAELEAKLRGVAELEAQVKRVSELEAKLEWALKRIEVLEAENAALRAQVADLQARLNQNSRNSSRPPSSDLPSVERPKREPSGRKRGGQPGHPGHQRRRLEPTEVIHVKPNRCKNCNAELNGEDPEPLIHQVVELPPVFPQVTEYRLHGLNFACGVRTFASLPSGVTMGGFGPRLLSFVALCTGGYRMGKRLVQQLLRDSWGIEVALGTISKMEQQVSNALAPAVDDALAYVREQHVLHQDETSWREGTSKAWLWVTATQCVTVFRVAARRAAEVSKQLLEGFAQFLVTDRLASYAWYAAELRQVCWAHLIRDFRAIAERSGTSGKLGLRLLGQAREMFVLWYRIRDGTLSRRGFQLKMRKIEARVGRLLRQGCQCGHAKTEGTALEILKVEGCLWTFVHEDGVEPTNNLAERQIRIAVMWRKMCCGTQSARGSRFAERILTVVATMRQQRRSALEYLTTACSAALKHQPFPSLRPMSA